MSTEPLGKLLRRRRDAIELRDDELYRQVRVQLHHNGAVLRDEVPGSDIGSARFRVRVGQVVLSRIDARHGAIAVVPPELDGAVVSNDFWVFDLCEDVDIAYLDHFFETLQFREACNRASIGSTNRRRLRDEGFQAIPVPMPATREAQRSVVTRIDQQEDLACRAADRARDIIETAAEAYRAAVRHLLTTLDVTGGERDVDVVLDCVRAVAPPLDRANSATPGKLAEVGEPFRLAAGWRWVPLGAVCTHIVDCVNDTPEFAERPTGYLGLKTSNVRANRLVLDETWHVTEEDFDRWNRRLAPREDDLILTREAPMGFVARVPAELRVCLTQRLVLLRTVPEAVNPAFLAHMLNDWLLLDQASALSKSQPPHLRVRDIPKLAVPMCGRPAQKRAVDLLDAALERVRSIERAAHQQLLDTQVLKRSIFTTAFAAIGRT